MLGSAFLFRHDGVPCYRRGNQRIGMGISMSWQFRNIIFEFSMIRIFIHILGIKSILVNIKSDTGNYIYSKIKVASITGLTIVRDESDSILKIGYGFNFNEGGRYPHIFKLW